MSAFSQLTGLASNAENEIQEHDRQTYRNLLLRRAAAEAKRIRKIRNVSTESDKLEDIAESNAERKKTQFDNKSYDSERRGMERASETARVNAEAKKSNDEAELRARARQAPPIGAGGIWTRGKRKIGRDINDPTRVAEQRARRRRVMGNSFR